MDQLIPLLTGAFIAIISPSVSGYFNIFVKKKEYENEYFKQIVSKRLTAYEQLNQIIYIFKGSVQDDDGKVYHMIFQNEESFSNFHIVLFNNKSNSFWYSENLSKYLLELFKELGKIDAKNKQKGISYSEIAKEEYKNLATLRDKIEIEMVKDLPKLYDINNFLNSKKIETSFLKRNLAGEYFEEETSNL